LLVALSDFANDVNNTKTDFTTALAGAFGADPANITLVYYAAGPGENLQRQQRRLMQTTTQSMSTPTTTVESKIRVFASTPRATAAEVTTRLLLSVPGINITGLQTTPIVIPGVPGIPIDTPEPATTNATDSSIIIYAVGGGVAFILFVLFLVVVCGCGCSRDDQSKENKHNQYHHNRHYQPIYRNGGYRL